MAGIFPRPWPWPWPRKKKQVVFGRATDGEPGMDFIGRFKGGDLVF